LEGEVELDGPSTGVIKESIVDLIDSGGKPVLSARLEIFQGGDGRVLIGYF